MSTQSPFTRVQQDLTRAMASGRLPAQVQARAETLLARITKPVRLGLLGQPQTGKSLLLNLLVGTDVVPTDLRLPTLELTYGAAPCIICTLADGTKTTVNSDDLRRITALAPVFVEMQLPLPALGKISLLEVVAPDDAAALQRASLWAAKRTDVVLWCSQSFDAHDQRVWAQMPDLIKDHGFLMITKADILRANGQLDGVLARANALARDDFNQILAIATQDAIAARRADGSVDKDKMRASGGLALITAVLKQVASGKQSAVDAADMLLAQHPEAAAAPAPAPVIAPQAAPARHDLGKARPPKQAATRPAPPPTSAGIAAYQTAHDHIAQQGVALLQLAQSGDRDMHAKVMAQTVEQLLWLCNYLSCNDSDSDPLLQNLRATVLDAADLAQLMQMERRDSAVIEAVSLLLQVKRELQDHLAA
jgi:hypothetical protein